MAKDASFDVVSDYDLAEMVNAVDQARREIMTRFDFKGTAASLELAEGRTAVNLTGESDNQLHSIVDVLQSKLVKRGVSLKVLDLSAPIETGRVSRWQLAFRRGLNQDQAKQITKLIRASFPKVKTQVQGEAVRVTSPSRDELQAVIAELQRQDWDFPIQFNNYR